MPEEDEDDDGQPALNAVFVGVSPTEEADVEAQLEDFDDGKDGVLRDRMLALLKKLRLEHKLSLEDERDKFGNSLAELDTKSYCQTAMLRRNRQDNTELRGTAARMNSKIAVLEATLATLQRKLTSARDERVQLLTTVEEAHHDQRRAEMETEKLKKILHAVEQAASNGDDITPQSVQPDGGQPAPLPKPGGAEGEDAATKKAPRRKSARSIDLPKKKAPKVAMGSAGNPRKMAAEQAQKRLTGDSSGGQIIPSKSVRALTRPTPTSGVDLLASIANDVGTVLSSLGDLDERMASLEKKAKKAGGCRCQIQ